MHDTPLAPCRATFSAIESSSVDIFINGKTLSVRIELLEKESKFGQLIIVVICFGKTRFTAFNVLPHVNRSCVLFYSTRHFSVEKKENIRGGGEGKVSSFPLPLPLLPFFSVCSLQLSRYLDRKRMQRRLTGLGG